MKHRVNDDKISDIYMTVTCRPILDDDAITVARKILLVVRAASCKSRPELENFRRLKK